MYFLFMIGLISVFRMQMSKPGHIFYWACIAISYIVIVDAYHAVTIVDFDWRYRAPVYWAIWLIASFGAEEIIKALGFKLSTVAQKQGAKG